MVRDTTGTGHGYNPLWDEGPARPRLRQAHVAIALSIAAHAGLGYAVYELKIKPTYREYSDTAVIAELVKPWRPPPPPPPEPAEPPPVKQEAPPPPAPPITPREIVLPQGSISVPTLSFTSPEPPAPSIRELPAEPVRPPPPPVIVNPNWSARPSPEDMARYYPERAQRTETNGSVTLECQVTARGAVDGCQVLSETPEAYGFGDAALKLSRLFRMKPRMQDGQAVEGAVVKIPIAFRIAVN